jgi:hypothetical protein
LLCLHRGVTNRADRSSLIVGQILGWADLHYQRFGQWPKSDSGPVVDAKSLFQKP